MDLSHKLQGNVPMWDEIPHKSVISGDTIVPYSKGAEIQQFSFPGQFGTHIDFPAHFFNDGKRLIDFSVEKFVLKLIVIDISEKVLIDPSYTVTMEDVDCFERKYGIIPSNSFIALRIDWCKKWPDSIHGIKNQTPGWSLEVLKFLSEKRNFAAIGHETMDMDSYYNICKYGYQCEEYVLNSGKFQIELLNNLDQIPLIGATIVIAPINFPNANGMPVRPLGIIG